MELKTVVSEQITIAHYEVFELRDEFQVPVGRFVDLSIAQAVAAEFPEGKAGIIHYVPKSK